MTGVQNDHAAEAIDLLARAGKQGTDELGDNLRLDALVHANLAIAEQQRIANALQVALVDQLTAIAPYLTPVGAQVDSSIRIREYLDEGQWESIGQGVRS